MTPPSGTLRSVDRWFVDRGVPHLIPDYSATGDVFTRMFGFLLFVMFAQLFLTFTPEAGGWDQLWVFLLGAAAVLGAIMLVNRLRGRRLLQVPDDVGLPELTVFVVVPPLLRAVTTQNVSDFFQWAITNLVILGVGYLITSYGLFPMIPWAIRQTGRQLANIAQLFAKSLPLLLLFSAFLFVNAEIWQVASDIPWVFFAIVVAFILAIGVLFLGLGLRHALDDLNAFGSWADVKNLCANTPAASLPEPSVPTTPQPAPLGRGERTNLGLFMLVTQVVQIALVAVMLAVFYTVFGLFTVGEDTIVQWTTLTPETFETLLEFTVFGHAVVLTRSLLIVSGFIAAFGGLQFTVSLVTDATYRDEFSADLQHDLREVLAVRCRITADEG